MKLTTALMLIAIATLSLFGYGCSPTPAPEPVTTGTHHPVTAVTAGTPLPIFPEYDPRDAVDVWQDVNVAAMNASIAEWVTPQSEFTRAIGKDAIEAEFAANIGRWQFKRPIKMDGDEWRVDAYVLWSADFYNPEWDSDFAAMLPYVFVVDEQRQVVVSADAQYDKAEFIHGPLDSEALFWRE